MQIAVAVDEHSQQMRFYDSIPTMGPAAAQQVFGWLKQWHKEELERTRGMLTRGRLAVLDGSQWRFLYNPLVHGSEPPAQCNGIDCGIFAVQAIKHLVAGRPLSYGTTVGQSYIQHIRKLMLLELASGRLMREDMWVLCKYPPTLPICGTCHAHASTNAIDRVHP